MLLALSEIVKSVGRDILSWRNTAWAKGEWHGSQLKTEADIRAHQLLSAKLNQLTSAIPVISEEDERGQIEQRPMRYWIIDPIDGTASFSEGFPGFVTQVALIENNRPVLAAIYAPVLDILYLSERGKGVTVNGVKLEVKPRTDRCLFIDNYPEPRGMALKIYDQMAFTGYVESGSIALKICRIADNTADLFFKDIVVRDWDIAPAHLILEEAGGALYDLRGCDIPYSGTYRIDGVVAANSQILARKLVSVVHAVGKNEC